MVNNGYWKKMIEVDMTTGTVNVTDRHMQYVDEYLGGRALGIKMLWEALKDNPGADALGPDVPLMFLPGPMCGVPFPAAASRHEVVTKSPLTYSKLAPFGEQSNTVAWSNCGGKFGPTLKMAGFDMVYVTGVSATPKILVVTNNKVELQDADKYWGMTTMEFEEAVQKDFGPAFKNTCIGPAGENLMRIASIQHEAGRASARAGVGCVMGAKKLKGIVVSGNQLVPYANPEGLAELREQYINKLETAAYVTGRRRYGSAAMLTGNDGKNTTYKNWRGCSDPYNSETGSIACITEFWVRHRSCWGCPIYCMKAGRVTEGPHKGVYTEGPEYESGTISSGFALTSMGDFAYLMDYAEKFGIDQLGMGGVVQLALECYEKGWLTSDMIQGIKLEWGNATEIAKFIEGMIYKQDECDVFSWFAKGPRYAAEKLGPEVVRIAPEVKNHAYNVMMPQNMVTGFSFSTRGACHLYGANPTGVDNNIVRDMGGFCNAPNIFAYGITGMADVLNYVMGIELTPEQYTFLGEKCSNIERMFNCLNGFGIDDDQLPARVYEEPVWDGALKDQVVNWDDFVETRRSYYESRGWDTATGKPTEGKLQELGLNDMIPYLAKIPY